MALRRVSAGASSRPAGARATRQVGHLAVHSTQQDPIGVAGGANVYGFAGGDPVNFEDPFGTEIVFKGAEARYQFARLKAMANGMSRSRDATTSGNGSALLTMLDELERSKKKLYLYVDKSSLFGGDWANGTGTIRWYRGGGVGSSVSSTQFEGIPVPVLLAHELAHAHVWLIQGGGQPTDADRTNANAYTNLFAISMENMVRASLGCSQSRPLDNQSALRPTSCR